MTGGRRGFSRGETAVDLAGNGAGLFRHRFSHSVLLARSGESDRTRPSRRAQGLPIPWDALGVRAVMTTRPMRRCPCTQ